jgi:hypothetical protein
MAGTCTPKRSKRSASAASLQSPSPSKFVTPKRMHDADLQSNDTPRIDYELYPEESPIVTPSRANTVLYCCGKIIPCCPDFIRGPNICLKCDLVHSLPKSIPNDATAVLVVGQPFVAVQHVVKRRRVVK